MRSQDDQQADVPRSALPPGVVAVLLLGLVGCILFGVRSCREPEIATPPPAAAPAPDAPATNMVAMPAPIETTNAPALDRETAALTDAHALFDRYTQQLRAANFESASNTLQAIGARLYSPELESTFWDNAIPADLRATLTLQRMCLLCKEGHCWRCDGAGACVTCDGTGVCANCKGQSARQTRCTACRCATCGGDGQCVTCDGQGLVRCTACGGTGSASVSRRVACTVCGGTGKREGLKRAGGVTAQSLCLTCRGSGQRDQSQYGACPTCKGQGRTACPACNAGSRCAACGGLGRSGACTRCSGSGQLRIACPKCQGAGRCADCKGTQRCANCTGSGACPKCAGRGVMPQMSLPVNRQWLTADPGYRLVDAHTGERLAAQSGIGDQQVSIRGRTMSFTVGTNEFILISTEGNFSRARDILNP